MEEFNILEHSFAPKYSVLTEEEIKELLKQYNIALKQLPKILSNDPVAKSLNVKKGDVLKITRKSPSAKESVFYRVVVDA